MAIKEFIFFCFPFLLYVLFAVVVKPWFIFIPANYIVGISFFACLVQILIFYFYKNIKSKVYLFSGFIVIIWLVCSITFPIKNLTLGDGVILLETFILETKVYGYDLILDEILEGLIHSKIYNAINSEYPNPMISYQLASNLAGIILVIFLFLRERINFKYILPLFASGGSLLFFGYTENYTLVSLTIIIFLFTGISLIEAEEFNFKNLNKLTFIASISVLMHLVSGYLLFSLIYLCFIFSEKKDFIKNAFKSTIVSLLVITPIVLYFFFFADLRFDLSLSHVSNAKFYPISRMISTGHLKEIFYCMILTSFPQIIIILYFRLFHQEIFSEVFRKKQGKFALIVLCGLLLHAFVHNPQLGFPTDWDLMSFYWIGFTGISFLLLKSIPEIFPKFLPVILFGLTINIFNAVELNKEDPKSRAELEFVIKSIDDFIPSYKNLMGEVQPKDRKFHLKTAFFLFKTKSILKKYNSEHVAIELIKENLELENEFRNNFAIRTATWNKIFLTKATKYNISYLDFIKSKEK